MARLQAFRERKKNTLSNKNVTQSINTQSSNETVLVHKQSPPTIDGETLYGNNLSESETAASEQIIDSMQNFRASMAADCKASMSSMAAEFKTFAAEIRNITHTAVEMNANLTIGLFKANFVLASISNFLFKSTSLANI